MRSPLRFVPLDAAASLAFLAYSASATVTPIVLVTLGRELDFGLVGGGSLEVARSTLIFLTLLGSGFLAAHFGKVRSLGMALLLLGLGMLLYSQAGAYGWVILALCLAGIAGGIVEALINPLVEELHRDDSGRYLNIINGFWSVGVLGTMLIGGEVQTRAQVWRPLLWGIAALALLAGAMTLLLNRTAASTARPGLGAVMGHKMAILRSRGFWFFSALMFFGGAAEGGYTFWAASFLQLEHGLSARAGGIGTACFALGMITLRFVGGWWIAQRQLKAFVMGSAASGLLVSLLFPLVPPGAALYALLFLAGASVACFWPSLQALAVERLHLESTSLFILLSCGGIAGFSFSSWALGWIGARAGLSAAFYLIPLFFAALLACLGIRDRERPESG